MTIDPRIKQLLTKCVLLAESLAQKAWFSYATILLLQIKVTWAMWHFRDLTSGDTSNYFVNAYAWFERGLAPISWSPLYVSFYASLLHLSSDVFTVTTLHRWLIVVVLAVLVLALMRRLLPPELAWLMSAWWVVLPINFDALYEVHLFAVIPVLCAALVILAKPGPWYRGAAVAILFAASILIRNELLVASGLLAVMLLAATIWKARRGQSVNRGSILAYGIPLVCACLLIAYFYVHANDAADLSGALERKHTLNICQTYAFGYEQRHTDFSKSPWTECQELMSRVYGKPEPTLLEAVVKNPSAMMEHFFWNLRLLPNGLQVLLFNSTFDHVSPDYAPVEQSWRALLWTLVVLAIVAAGSIRLLRNRQYWWEAWLKARAWGWGLLIAVCCVTASVMISQRPRPSYMFTLGILLRAAVGMLLLVLMGKSVYRKWLRLAFPVVAILMIAVIPSYYDTNYQKRPRTLMKGYERLAEYENLLQRPAAVLVSPGYNYELCNYVGKGSCRGLNYFDLRTQVTPVTSWAKVLESSGATLVYADEAVLSESAGQRLVQESISSGWRTLSFADSKDQHWVVLGKAGATSDVPTTPGVRMSTDDIPVVGDWNGDGRPKIGLFRKGLWFLDINGTHTYSKAIGWGQPGDIPVVGDWNGDGRTKIGVFSKGFWYLDIDGSHQVTSSKIIGWGQPGDIPLVGDWNQDGRMKIGVFRSNTWFLDTNGSHQLNAASQITTDVK